MWRDKWRGHEEARNAVGPKDPVGAGVGGGGQVKVRPWLQNGYAVSLDK